MGSNHSARRKSANQLTPSHSVPSTVRSSASTSLPKRSKVRRSSSEKYVKTTNSVVPVNGWAVTENKRAASTLCDIGLNFDENEPSVSDSVHSYQPNGVTSWKMIDEDSLIISTSNTKCPSILTSSYEETISTVKQQLNSTDVLSTIAMVAQPQERSLTSVSSSNNGEPIVCHDTDKFLSKTLSVSSRDEMKASSDSCCTIQSKSSQIGSTIKNVGDVSASEMCSCRLSYRQATEQVQKKTSEVKEFKESSVNSAASRDSGRASSVDATAKNGILPAVDDLCLSLDSLGSDELMLDTEAENFSTVGCDSHRSSFDAGRVGHRRRSSVRSGHYEQRPLSLGTGQKRRSCGYVKWQNTDDTEFLMHKPAPHELHESNGEFNPLQELSSLVRLHQSHRSSRELPGQLSQMGNEDNEQIANNRLSSSLMRTPRPNYVETTAYTLDGLTYRRVMQDVTQFKTSLLKLKRLLQEDELRSSSLLKMGSECDSCASPMNASFMVGYFCDGSTPTTPVSNFDLSSMSMEDCRNNPTLADLLKENAELKVQCLRLQQVSEQQKATILLLQQQMTKYELCDESVLGTKLVAS